MHITVHGGGISGCISAFALAQAGHKVTLYEAATLGTGASGKALGGLFPYTDNIQTKLAAVQRHSITLWPALAQQLATAASQPVEAFFRDYGHAKQINPASIFPILRAGLQNVGVTLHENTPAPIPTGPTLLAMGWGNKPWQPELHVKQGQALRVSTHIKLPQPIYGEDIYLLPGWTENEILIGSSKRKQNEPDNNPPEPAVTADLLARGGRLLPGLESAQVISVWTGHRPTASPVLPLLRPVENTPHTYVVAALGGMGYCLAPALAQTTLEAFS